MAKKKTEKFMTPKAGHKFYRGRRCFMPGDKIPEVFFKDAKGEPLKDGKGKALKFPALEEWQEPKPADNKKNDPPPANDPPPFGPEQI
jgi:hypothetical protein